MLPQAKIGTPVFFKNLISYSSELVFFGVFSYSKKNSDSLGLDIMIHLGVGCSWLFFQIFVVPYPDPSKAWRHLEDLYTPTGSFTRNHWRVQSLAESFGEKCFHQKNIQTPPEVRYLDPKNIPSKHQTSGRIKGWWLIIP